MDATKRPIQINPEFATYAEEHGIFDLYKRLLSKLLIDMPEDPLHYLHDKLKQEDDNLPQIIVFGPPVSGKWCVASKISELVKAPHLDPEGILADAPKELMIEVNRFKNKELPDELWVRLISERLNRYDCSRKGWVLDGFPETVNQAKALQAVGIIPKHVILLEAPDTLLLERADGKRIDPMTNEVYHKVFDYPNDTDVQKRLVEPNNYSQEVIVQRLVNYHRNIGSIIDAYKPVSKKVNADQPKTDVFSQVEAYICQDARSQAPHTPRVLLLGPTGAGKAVQAALLASKYNIVNVSVPQLLQQAIESELKLGLAIKPYVQQDISASHGSDFTRVELSAHHKGYIRPKQPWHSAHIVTDLSVQCQIPENLVMAVIAERLSRLDALSRGWIMHGYPKTLDQAATLDQDGFKPNRVIFLDVPNDVVLERLTLRATDPISGERYHMLYNPPRTMQIKERLVQHPRDSDEEVRKRLGMYYAHNEDLRDYYKSAARVNADQDPHTVFEFIESTMVNPLPRKLTSDGQKSL